MVLICATSRFRVISDSGFRGSHRVVQKIGAKIARLDNEDTDAQRSQLLRQRFRVMGCVSCLLLQSGRHTHRSGQNQKPVLLRSASCAPSIVTEKLKLAGAGRFRSNNRDRRFESILLRHRVIANQCSVDRDDDRRIEPEEIASRSPATRSAGVAGGVTLYRMPAEKLAEYQDSRESHMDSAPAADAGAAASFTAAPPMWRSASPTPERRSQQQAATPPSARQTAASLCWRTDRSSASACRAG
jgi:hypothetical protein